MVIVKKIMNHKQWNKHLYMSIYCIAMPLLEVDLGQTSTYSNNGISGTQVSKFLGVVELNNTNLQFSTPLHLTNRPNPWFNVKKLGTREYILILTFEKI